MDEDKCSRCGGSHSWDGNISTCQGCGLVGLHFEGGLPEIIDAIDFAIGEEEQCLS